MFTWMPTRLNYSRSVWMFVTITIAHNCKILNTLWKLCWFFSSFLLPVSNCCHALWHPCFFDHHHGRYNPDTDSWSTDVAPLSSPRSGVCLVAMDGYLYAIGGHDGITAINTVERYCSMSRTRDQYLTEFILNLLKTYCKTLSGTMLYYFS